MLDFISYDSYPNFSTIFSTLFPGATIEPLQDRYWSWLLSVARSISPHFCAMEQQSGPGGWTNRIAQPAPKPGQMRLWTYQSIAYGADMVLYFRWRTAPMGTEIYWHGINDYHNCPNRRVAEAAQIGRELETLGPRLVTTQTSAQVALVSDYDNEWDGELDSWHDPYTRQSLRAWFTALQYRHIPDEGQEVVQLYMHDVAARLIRPPKEMKGFAKVSLTPGETTTVTLTLDRAALAYWDDAKQAWVAEASELEALNCFIQSLVFLQ